MELPAEQPADHSDFETESNGETEEERMYDETLQYLMHDKYPECASKQDKGVILKRSKYYRVRDGQLYRVCSSDYFTKWPEACATPTKEAIHVANFLFDLFLHRTSLYQTKERTIWLNVISGFTIAV